MSKVYEVLRDNATQDYIDDLRFKLSRANDHIHKLERQLVKAEALIDKLDSMSNVYFQERNEEI